MTEEIHTEAAIPLSFHAKHKLLLLIILVVGIAIALVFVSMSLYSSSGAAQLDLSRPGYRAVSNQVINDQADTAVYPASGPIDQKALNDFRTLYDKQSGKIKAVDAFGNDPLSDQSLGIDDVPTTQQ